MVNQPEPAGQRRLIFTADIVGFGAMTDSIKERSQSDLRDVLDSALSTARTTPDETHLALEGDSVIAIIPGGRPEAETVTDLVRGAHNRLRSLNDGRAASHVLRLRLACGQGIVEMGRTGLGSSAVVDVCRIRDAEATRAALRERPDALLVVALSGDVYRSTVVPGRLDLRPGQTVAATVAEKELTTTVWLWLPDPPQPAATLGERPPAAPEPSGGIRPGAGAPGGERATRFIEPGDLVPGDWFTGPPAPHDGFQGP